MSEDERKKLKKERMKNTEREEKKSKLEIKRVGYMVEQT